MSDVLLFIQTVMGGVDPSDALLCVQLAASTSWANGGLFGFVGPSSPPMDPGSAAGADDLTPTAARGKTKTVSHDCVFSLISASEDRY